MSHQNTDYAPEDIAIIGMAGRFPGAKDIDVFWQNLRDGVESISFFSDEELDEAGVSSAERNDPNYVKARGIMDDVDLFAASFFGVNPREAESIDPQHRIFLECAWEALENAGYNAEAYEGAIGVYAGSSMNTYIYNLISNPDAMAAIGSYQIMIGNDKDFVPTRVSYKLNLKGPSVNIQTACSTSLVAVQLATQSLLDFQCDMALAGGVSAYFPQKTGYVYQEGMIQSPDGHCRAFDAQAQGIVAGEGVGIVVLKRLADAIEDGDHVYAVIKGAAINNDGSLKVGYTAPSVDGQAEAIATAHALAKVNPETITYIETHGTGTALGDPIEITALTEAFRAGTAKKAFCAIGSVKTNIGHLDAAAGVAGLIKTVLALKNKQLPPSLHFKEPNPKIDFVNSPFFVNAALSEWKTNGTPRRAGVSSFGIGGTNAHVVLEEAPIVESPDSARPWQLLLLSAKSNTALETMSGNLAEHFKRHPNLNLADAAYTLQVGRQAFNHRRMVVCRDVADAANALETLDAGRVNSSVQKTGNRPVAFMFTGQGAQYVNMGLELYRAEPIFREQIDRCADVLQPHLGLDLRQVLYPAEEQVEAATQQLRQTNITQPALFVIEYALARLWQTWGIQPQMMIGHSIGEYVAACLAGVFSLEEALGLVAARGRLMQSLPKGAMLAVPMPEAKVAPLLNRGLSLAVINSPAMSVISGSPESIDKFETQLAAQGVECRQLHTSHAFHSDMMDPILESFIAEVSRITLKPPQTPFISNVTGTWITASEATDPAYWARHLRQTVRFAAGIEQLLQEPDLILLEVGPGRTLSTLVRQHPNTSANHVILGSLRHPQTLSSDAEFIFKTLGQLWLAGLQPDWSGFYAQEHRHRRPLPTYPFERQRYWVEPGQQLAYEGQAHQIELYKKPDIADWFYLPSWKRSALPKPAGQEIRLSRNCLVFVDECGLGSRIKKQLENGGHNVISVFAGEKFNKTGDSVYTVNPQTRDGYDSLLKDLRASNMIPDMIMHLWSVTPITESETFALERLTTTQDLGFYSLLFLTQALGEQAGEKSLRIQVVSNNMQEVIGGELLCPEKATVLGPGLVAPYEYPHIAYRNIDIVLPAPNSVQEDKLIGKLVDELFVESSDSVVAHRGQYRWVQTFEAMPLGEAGEDTPLLRDGGVYLITGGLGGIGFVLAEYLAETVRAKLVLTGRSALPDRAEWQQWLATHNEQDSTSKKMRKVLALEELGAEVLVFSADVTNPEQMQGVVRQTVEQFGEINGVVHASGVAGGGIIQLKTPEMANEVLSSKVRGTLVLNTALSDQKLDLFVLCSSINSILTTVGQVDYCGANAFLDAFAHQYSANNDTTCISVNWDTWQEVGMAVDTEVPPQLIQEKEKNLEHGLLDEEGRAVFKRILNNPSPQILVSTQDFNRLVKLSKQFAASNSSEQIAKETLSDSGDNATTQKAVKQTKVSSLHPRPNLQNAYVASRNEFEEKVVNIWQDLLGIDQIGVYDDFFDLGGHSLLATQVVSRLREIFKVEVPLRSMFETTTVAELVETLDLVVLTAQKQQTTSDLTTDDREEIEL